MIAVLLACLLLSSSFAPSAARLVDQESVHPQAALDSFPVPNAELFVFPKPKPFDFQPTAEDKLAKSRTDIV